MAGDTTDSTMRWKLDISDLKANIQQSNRLIKEANSEFKAVTSSMDSWSKSADGLTARKKQLNSILEQENNKLKDLKEQYRLVVENEGENSRSAQELTTKINNQVASIGKNEKALRDLDTKLIDARKSGKLTAAEFNNLASEEAKLTLKTEETKKQLTDLKEVTGELSTKVKNGLVVSLKAGVTALAGMLAYSSKVGASFQSVMSEVQAISGATAEELELLTEKAKEMGIKTKFSATEAGEALKYMAMAGWKTTDMLEGLDGIINLAAASNENLGTVSDIVTDAITAFGLSAKDSAHFADVLAQASSSSNTNVSLMGETFKESAALAGAMKYSVDDVAVAVGLMANAGIKGSKSGTALKNAIANMAKPTEAMADIMEEYNLSLANADGSMKPLIQVINELRGAFGGLSEDQQASVAATLFGKEAMAGMLSVVNASEADYVKLQTAIQNADGASKRMSDTMIDNVKGALTIAGSTAEGLGIQLFDVFKDDLKKAIQGVTKELTKFGKELDKPATKQSLKTLANLVFSLIKNVIQLASKAIPPLIKGLGLMIDNSDKLIPLITGLATAMLIYHTKTAIATKTTGELNAIQLLAKGTSIAFNTVMGLLNGTIDAQIVKTQLLNALHTATPWGMLALGVTGVVSAYMLLSGATDENVKKAKALREEAIAQKESFDELIESKQKMMAESVAEIDYYSQLKQELTSLVDENGKVKEGYEGRANYILGELNKSLGTEIEMTDGVITNYQEQIQVLDELMQKKRAQAILNAGEEAYAEAIKNQTKAWQEVSEAHALYAEKEAEWARIEAKQIKDGIDDRELAAMRNVFFNMEEVKALQTAVDQKTLLAQGYTDTIAQQEYLQQLYAEGSAESIKTINDSIVASYNDKGERVVLSTQQQIQNEESLLSYLQQKYIETGDAMYLSQINASANRLEQLKKDLNDQKTTIDTENPEITSAWERLSQNGVDAFAKNTEDYKLIALEQTLRAKKGINAGTPETEKAWEYLASQGLAKLDENGWEYTETGEQYVKGVKSGIENEQGNVYTALAGLGTGMISSLKKSLDIHSPSREGKNIGKLFDSGVELGVTENTVGIKKSIQKLGKTMITEAKKAVPDLSRKLSLNHDVVAPKLAFATAMPSSPAPMSQAASPSISYQQIINSPKPINSLEVYRQTNNLLFSAKNRRKKGG